MKRITYILSIVSLVLLASCGKTFLDRKPNQQQLVPQTLDDFQAMLDYPASMNESSCTNLGLLGGDEYWVTAAQYNTSSATLLPNFQKNAYIWADLIYQGRETTVDWNSAYSHILLANLALEATEDQHRTTANQDKWDLLRGDALFFRSLNFFLLSQLYCPVYDSAAASGDLGLPLRMGSDPTVKVSRSNLTDTYQQIIKDLSEATTLLTDTPQVVFRPSKAAAYALFTRIYMQMGDYVLAKQYADSCLTIKNALTNFNTISPTATLSFPLNGAGNPEVIFMDNDAFIQLFNYFRADTVLLNSYANGDLRYNAYWTTGATQVQFKGSYKGSSNTAYFTGFATDEIYLNRAECLARGNKPAEALADLNAVRQNRFTPAAYAPLQSSDPQQVLDWVITERRKELVMRGTRWGDLRRLNKDPRYATTLVRLIDPNRYELKPGDTKWTWPLPVEAIQNGGYEQNAR